MARPIPSRNGARGKEAGYSGHRRRYDQSSHRLDQRHGDWGSSVWESRDARWRPSGRRNIRKRNTGASGAGLAAELRRTRGKFAASTAGCASSLPGSKDGTWRLVGVARHCFIDDRFIGRPFDRPRSVVHGESSRRAAVIRKNSKTARAPTGDKRAALAKGRCPSNGVARRRGLRAFVYGTCKQSEFAGLCAGVPQADAHRANRSRPKCLAGRRDGFRNIDQARWMGFISRKIASLVVVDRSRLR